MLNSLILLQNLKFMENQMLNKFLGFLIGVIIIFVTAITAIAIFKKNAIPGQGLERAYDEIPDVSQGKFGKDVKYNLIGKLWIPLKKDDEKSSTLIVSPWLEYKEDRTFYEEMDRKHEEIKRIVTNFFANMTMREIQTRDEELLKRELVSKINEILVLGKINRILFNDFQFISE